MLLFTAPLEEETKVVSLSVSAKPFWYDALFNAFEPAEAVSFTEPTDIDFPESCMLATFAFTFT